LVAGIVGVLEIADMLLLPVAPRVGLGTPYEAIGEVKEPYIGDASGSPPFEGPPSAAASVLIVGFLEDSMLEEPGKLGPEPAP